jgi:sulfite exporter TauE/SafE
MHHMQSGDFSMWAAVTFGLLTSFGHCIGMCSGIVVAYSTAKLDGKSRGGQLAAHLLYSLGRICTYAALGLIAGVLGAALSVSAPVKAIVMIALGLVMILIGVSLLGWIKFLPLLESGGIIQSGWYRRTFGTLIGSKSLLSVYGIGVLNGLIPCGAVYAALAMAITAPSAAGSAAAMALFGAATAPSLFLAGAFTSVLAMTKFRGVAVKLAALVVIALGALTLWRSITALLS